MDDLPLTVPIVEIVGTITRQDGEVVPFVIRTEVEDGADPNDDSEERSV